jgi:hypothetical protein
MSPIDESRNRSSTSLGSQTRISGSIVGVIAKLLMPGGDPLRFRHYNSVS